MFHSARGRALLVALLTCTGVSYAQTTYGTITGNVTDPTGAVVPGVKITARNVATGVTATALSNQAGDYSVPQLAEGTYDLRAEGSGFKDFVVQGMRISMRDLRRLDIPLQLGSASTRVEVSGGTVPQLETESTRVADIKTADMLKTMPMNARWLWDYFYQVPNLTYTGDGYRFAGTTGNLTNISIDGTTIMDGQSWHIGPLLNYMEMVQEVSSEVNNGAEFAAAGNIDVVSKSGTNQFHGTAYDQFWTPGLTARNYFASGVGRTRFHIFGGGLGGPVFLPKVYNGKNKTFFYAQFERSAGNGTTSWANTGVPLSAWRGGDFSGLGATIYDPASQLPFAGNQIPASRINPVSQKIQDQFYPLPNHGPANVFSSSNYQQMVNYMWTAPWLGNMRIDHHFSENDFVFGRLSITGAPTASFQGLESIGWTTGYRETRAATLSYTHIFSPALLNEARWGINFNDNTSAGPIKAGDELQRLGLTGLAPGIPANSPAMLNVYWSGLGLKSLTQRAGDGPPGFRNFNNQFQDYVTIFHGRHTIKTGIELVRTLYDDQPIAQNMLGAVTFSSQFTSGGQNGQGSPYADFLLGIPTTSNRAFPALRGTETHWSYAGFVSDQFKITPALTLTMGLRYQVNTPWSESHGRMAVFDIGTGSIVVPNQGAAAISPLFPNSYVPVMSASAAHLPQTLVGTDHNDWAPRLSVAWRPWGNTTVFRAGFNIFYDIVPMDYLTQGSPFQLSEFSHSNPRQNPDVILPRVYPDRSSDTAYDSVGLPIAVNPNLRSPMTQMYTFGVEHQVKETVLSLTYFGTAQRYGLYTYNYNSPLPNNLPYAAKARPFPAYPEIDYRTNGAGHQYNGLTSSVKHNMGRGLHMNFNWTWQRDIGDLERWDSPEDPYNRQRERGVNSAFPTHRIVANGYYEMPFGKGQRFRGSAGRLENLLVGNWVLSSTLGYDSGQFLTPYWSGPDPTGTAFTDSGTPAWVTLRPDQLANPNGSPTLAQWFNPAAFGAPEPGQFGTSAKGVIKGPDCLMWNAGLSKTLYVAEKGPRVMMQVQVKNITNRRNWSNPDTNITDVGSVGRITWDGGVYDSASPRTATLVLRVEF